MKMVRGIDKKTGKWLYTDCFKWENGKCYLGIKEKNNIEYREIIPESYGEFTGKFDNRHWNDLPDREKELWQLCGFTEKSWKGTPIFEGDIIRAEIAGCFEPLILEVFLDRKRACWNLKDETGANYYDFLSGLSPFDAIQWCEVIGNAKILLTNSKMEG